MAGPPGTVTFLFTDIVGSTRLWQLGEEAMRAAVARHDEILLSVIAEHGGFVFSKMGDGVAAAFTSGSSAVAAALAAQRCLDAESWPTASRIRVRMGLHTGEAELRDGSYFGTAVNRAARLMAVGHGGQVLCSAVTAGLLESDAPLRDLGEHRLRDLDRAMHVFQVGAETFEPLRSLDALPGNLPSLASSFVGRQAELAAVAEQLAAARLVTLTGVGGMGKTRLALQVAGELVGGFADGAWVCELAAAAGDAELAQVVATALGVVQRQGMTLVESVVDFLRARRLLIVLDNCEHLLDAAGQLAEAVLAGCPGIRILATSREGLGIGAEQVWPLRSLALEAPASESSDAVVLFAERARAVAPDFVFDAVSGPQVMEICRRLDGIPLAIELAAARVTAMSPAEIAGHLDERFRLLTGARRGRVERHQTLQAAVDWSYSLLSDAERTVFDRLGVFPASFDEAAAVAVCTGDAIERWDVIDSLASLVAKSMIGVERSADATRFQLLETMRQFARERAGPGESLDGLRRRHAAYYAGFAEQAGAGMLSPDELAWRRRVAAELDNLRAATGWAFDAANLDDVGLGVAVIEGLFNGLEGANSFGGILGLAAAGMPRVEQLTATQRAVVLKAAAWDAHRQGRFDQARLFGGRVLAESDTFTTAGRAIMMASLATGDVSAAMSVMAEGERRLEALGASDVQACAARVSKSLVTYLAGQPEIARSEALQALASARQLAIPTLLALALYAHGLAVSDQHPEAALAALEESIGLIEAGAGDSTYSSALQTAAALHSARGDVASAARSIQTALQHDARAGGRTLLATDVAVAALVLGSHPDGALAAATLAGAVSGKVFGHIQSYLRGAQADRYAQTLVHLAATLGPDAFGEAQQRGAAMTYDEIIDFACSHVAQLANSS